MKTDSTSPRIGATGLNCPSCGAGISLSTLGWSVTVVCGTCGSVLDAQHPGLRILQEFERRMTVEPRIPLGSRGTLRGTAWEVVGFQEVTITVDGVDYSWTEYVCFNPFHGFLYLSEYEGHWNVIEKLHRRPDVVAGMTQSFAFEGHPYKHFQTAKARTTFALGEFPWEVNVGDSIVSRDFVSPPFLLSAESTELETTWSRGEYTNPDLIWKAFKLKESARHPVGVFANQPNPHRAVARKVGRLFALMLVALVLMFVANNAIARRDTVFSGQFQFNRADGDSTAFVTEPFELKGRTSNVRIGLTSDVDNDWVWFNLALINEETGQALDVGRQVSYYHGRDSDGNWSEGSRRDNVTLGSVASGRYILRVAPEGGEAGRPLVRYSIQVRRDVPSFGFYFGALLALIIPAVLFWLPSVGFEQRRWAESDHAPSASSDDDDGDSGE